MAIIKLGAAITDIQGKVGGSVFQKSAAGLTLRNNTHPINKRSNALAHSRSAMALAQFAWQGLTDAQRGAWNMYAEFRKIKQNNISGKFINGHQVYLRENFYNIFFDHQPKTNPSFIPPPPPADLILGEDFSVTYIVTTDDNLAGTAYALVLLISSPQSNTRFNPPSRFRLMSIQVAGTNIVDVTVPYTAVYGTIPPSNSTTFVKYAIRETATGALSNFVVGRTPL